MWAKFSKTWFPAMVVDGFLAKVNPPRTGNLWVYWFGDHKVSEVRFYQMNRDAINWSQGFSNRLNINQLVESEA